MSNFVNIGNDNTVIFKNMDFGDKLIWPEISFPLHVIHVSLCKFPNVFDLMLRKSNVYIIGF